MGYAHSDNIYGPYTQSSEPIIINDGGHSTWFRNGSGIMGDGELLIVYHIPNSKTEHPEIRKLLFNRDTEQWYVEPAQKKEVNWFIKNKTILISLGVFIIGFFSLMGIALAIKNKR